LEREAGRAFGRADFERADFERTAFAGALAFDERFATDAPRTAARFVERAGRARFV
jgi:hypothetical protein